MKRMTIVLSTVILAAQAALAQQPPGPPRGGPPVEQMARELGLDDTRKAEVKRIFEEQRAKREAERQQLVSSGERPSPETMRTMRERHEQELMQALSGVLTTEQLTKFRQLQAERRQNMRGGPPAPPPRE